MNEALLTSDSPEWYSPPEIVRAALDVLGAIDLDPCSDSREQPNVPASTVFTADDDGLAQPWRGRVYLNPPYGRRIGTWIRKLVDHHRSGDVWAAIALLPARTDTGWFRRLGDFPRCFIDGRLRFSDAESGAPFPSAVAYLGPDVARFASVFGSFGDVFERTRPRSSCEHCGQAFLPRRSRGRFCRPACRQAAHRKRNANPRGSVTRKGASYVD